MDHKGEGRQTDLHRGPLLPEGGTLLFPSIRTTLPFSPSIRIEKNDEAVDGKSESEDSSHKVVSLQLEKLIELCRYIAQRVHKIKQVPGFPEKPHAYYGQDHGEVQVRPFSPSDTFLRPDEASDGLDYQVWRNHFDPQIQSILRERSSGKQLSPQKRDARAQSVVMKEKQNHRGRKQCQ